MQKTALVCLDFDGVLFKSSELVYEFPEVVGIGRENFLSAMREFRRRSGEEFMPRKLADYLVSESLLSEEQGRKLSERFETIRLEASRLVFDDAYPFLEAFPREMLCILSRAHPEWQMPNIESTGLKKYVSRVFVVQGDDGKRKKLLELSKTYSPLVLIDDMPHELEAAEGVPNLHKILINRGKIPSALGGAKDLREAVKMVQQILDG